MSFNVEKNVNGIKTWLKDYLNNSKTKGFVIGISGGKDSAVVASLLVEAVGKENVFGILMPNGTQSDINDSIAVCKSLNIDYTTVNINEAYEAMLNILPSTDMIETKINIVPRIRMITLYSVASEKNYLVCGTGNKSEIFVGYFTKWGDGACDINPIGDFTTEEVIEIGKYLNTFEQALFKNPSDGISNSSDEEKLGFLYTSLNEYIEKGNIPNKETEQKIIKKHTTNKHKTEPIPIFKRV